jgi:hypothetical protein
MLHWTWLTSKPKNFGSDIFVRPILFKMIKIFIKILTKKLTHEKERNNSLMAIEDFHHIQLVLL